MLSSGWVLMLSILFFFRTVRAKYLMLNSGFWSCLDSRVNIDVFSFPKMSRLLKLCNLNSWPPKSLRQFPVVILLVVLEDEAYLQEIVMTVSVERMVSTKVVWAYKCVFIGSVCWTWCSLKYKLCWTIESLLLLLFISRFLPSGCLVWPRYYLWLFYDIDPKSQSPMFMPRCSRSTLYQIKKQKDLMLCRFSNFFIS